MEYLRQEVKWFAEQMEAQLRRHDDRDGWKGCEIGWLLKRLHEEIGEFEEALWNKEKLIVTIKELADVGNFCMMIADVLYEKWVKENESSYSST